MKKKLLIIFYLLNAISVFSQKDSTKHWHDKFTFKLENYNRYIWRGMSWGGNFFVTQPSVNYQITNKLKAGIWATTNFKKQYYYPDGINTGMGYTELDIFLSYQIFDFLAVEVYDYYWPNLQRISTINKNYFNYGPDGTKTIDATLYFDFYEYKYPFNATISTLVAGNDFRYDSNGENPKQNFTTYAEVGYTFKNIYKAIDFNTTTGMVFNNQASYYSFASYDKPSWININCKLIKDIPLGGKHYLPISINYIHNPASENTDLHGKNFYIFGVSYKFE
jgi:hypothetical protein